MRTWPVKQAAMRRLEGAAAVAVALSFLAAFLKRAFTFLAAGLAVALGACMHA